jgi:mannose-6-phosphate isomerase class I
MNRGTSNYDKKPCVTVTGLGETSAWQGWNAIGQAMNRAMSSRSESTRIVAVECYPGVLDRELLTALKRELDPAMIIESADAFLPGEQIEKLLERDITSDPVFGRLTHRQPEELFDENALAQLRQKMHVAMKSSSPSSGPVLVYGFGATFLAPDGAMLVYADMARWEIQMRMRRGQVSNLGTANAGSKWSLQYKRAFFVDWRVADRLKKQVFPRCDFLLDTNDTSVPKLATGAAIRAGLQQTAQRPFRVVPFFDPAPWGGQWMKEVCDLDRTATNYGWCFDCVPEENSLMLNITDVTLEIPSINAVFFEPDALLGQSVRARFGTEFPIRFDFLDTISGGHLSFQVHPLTEYIQDHFGMHYTQDESYYMLDAEEGACVYLGLKEDVDPRAMANELRAAQRDASKPFDADRHANRWPAKKHDHFLIPAGTPHCSGKGAMVLEISATPYIFTFKMWDWGRLGLDGKPRPVHLDHGLANVQWDRRTNWTKANLINALTPIAQGPGWREEGTGLHSSEFIETRRHWFTQPVEHHTRGTLNVLNLVQGRSALVQSPTGAFEPFEVHYAETFIVPASVGPYTITPLTPEPGNTEFATLKAFVRDGIESR